MKDVKIFLNKKLKKKKKNKKFGSDCYKSLSEDKKQKFVEHRKKYYREKKCHIINIRKCFNLENFASL